MHREGVPFTTEGSPLTCQRCCAYLHYSKRTKSPQQSGVGVRRTVTTKKQAAAQQKKRKVRFDKSPLPCYTQPSLS